MISFLVPGNCIFYSVASCSWKISFKVQKHGNCELNCEQRRALCCIFLMHFGIFFWIPPKLHCATLRPYVSLRSPHCSQSSEPQKYYHHHSLVHLFLQEGKLPPAKEGKFLCIRVSEFSEVFVVVSLRYHPL